jgi:hypothetical protein
MYLRTMSDAVYDSLTFPFQQKYIRRWVLAKDMEAHTVVLPDFVLHESAQWRTISDKDQTKYMYARTYGTWTLKGMYVGTAPSAPDAPIARAPIARAPPTLDVTINNGNTFRKLSVQDQGKYRRAYNQHDGASWELEPRFVGTAPSAPDAPLARALPTLDVTINNGNTFRKLSVQDQGKYRHAYNQHDGASWELEPQFVGTAPSAPVPTSLRRAMR